MAILDVNIPNYNKGKFLKDCIDSVLNQTIKDININIFDNGSTDNSKEIIEEYKDIPNIKYKIRNKNEGALINWNDCLITGDSKYVTMLHSDDKWLNTHAEELIVGLEENNNCGLAYTPCMWIDENNNELGVVNHPGHSKLNYAGYRDELAFLLVYDCFLTISSVIFRRSDVEKVGLFHEVTSADWEYFLRFAEINSNFYFSKEATCLYRHHEEQQSKEFYNSDAPLITHVSHLLDALQYSNRSKFKGYENRIWNYLLNRMNMYPQSAYGLIWYIRKIEQYLNEIGNSY